MTGQLIERGLAYETAGNVYYDVSSFPAYGRLSGNTVESLQAGAGGRVQLEVAEDKRAPEDFALWKRGEKDRQMNWSSPWSVGFPGWHIECSAMATRYLGEQFDIHTGGVDLIFPHHEDEIAQSQGTSGKAPVQFWMHGEFINISSSLFNQGVGNGSDDAVKMSRSLGNVILLRHLKEWGFDPLAFRYSLLMAHYRSKMNFTRESLTAAQNGLNNLRADLAELPVVLYNPDDPWSEEARQVREAFQVAINDDMDLPVALSLALKVPRNTRVEPAEQRRLLLEIGRAHV